MKLRGRPIGRPRDYPLDNTARIEQNNAMGPRLLLINPWITDFAAFDLWARPLGLLYLAAALQKAGCEVRLVDCLDRGRPEARPERGGSGRLPGLGHWRREPLPLPEVYRGIPRRFARYGLPKQVFLQDLAQGPRPDGILVTSMMTYWYPGVFEAIRLARQVWPDAPILLGGVYATLCPDHARSRSGADRVIPGPVESARVVLEVLEGHEPDAAPAGQAAWTSLLPALDLYPDPAYAPLLTSRGCPLRCPYCASSRLYSGFVQRSPEDVLDEIEDRCNRLHIRDFIFFDDALLINAGTHLAPILEGVLARGFDVRFHAPNGLHVARITADLAALMRRAGFRTVRLGLETTDWDRQEQWGAKVGAGQIEAAVGHLRRAGFSPEEIGVYLLCGLPGQGWGEVLAAAETVRRLGARPYPAEYSPLPGTGLWDEARAASPFDIAGEPLFQNNSFFPCRGSDFSWEKAWEARRVAVSGSDGPNRLSES